MSDWHLSARAEDDLVDAWLEGARDFGVAQADRYQDGFAAAFELIATFPEMARVRQELTPPLRIHPIGSHLIVYQVCADGDVLVVRVRHRREDWATEPG